jgi:prophage antirepressor-like protein
MNDQNPLDFIAQNALVSEESFEGSTLRTVYRENEYWFVANDVASALGYAETSRAINKFCKGAAQHYPIQTKGGVQELRIINKPDLYRLVLKSEAKGAERFQDWIVEDLLPTLEREGSYHMALKDVPKRLFTLDEIDELVERHLPQIYTPVELPDYAKGIRTSSYEQRELDREGMRGRLREICGEYMKLRALYPLFEQTVKTACDTDNGCDVTSAESLLYTCMTFINHAKETFFSIPLAPEEIPNETLKVINFESIFANQFGKTWKTYIGEGRRLGGAGAEYGRDNWLTRK